MHNQNFQYKNNNTLFKISKNHDFTYNDKTNNFDYVYRVVDVTGNLTSKPDEFDADGYGFATVVKMSIEHLPTLDLNIKQMISNAINKYSLNKDLLVNKNDNSSDIEMVDDGMDLVILVKIIEQDAYVIIFDSMPNYLNYHFLFAKIHNFKNVDMSNIEISKKHTIKDSKNNFYFYFGDENTDSSFDDWLKDESSQIYKTFNQIGL